MHPADRWLGESGLRPMLLDGRLVGRSSGGGRAQHEPARGSVLSQIAQAGTVEIEAAVRSARSAEDQGAWPRMAHEDRLDRLRALAAAIEADREQLSRIASREGGLPLRESAADVKAGVSALRREVSRAHRGRGRIRRPHADVELLIESVPAGVVVALTPAYAAVESALGTIGRALAAGNAVIWKPPREATLTALRLAKISLDASLPRGSLQILAGDGETVGQPLAAHPGVDRVLLRGGPVAAQSLRAIRGDIDWLPARRGSMVVLRDADLDVAADFAVLGACYGQGRAPWGLRRLVVDKKVHDHLLVRIFGRLASLVLGDPIDPETELGPMPTPEGRAEAEMLVAQAKESGASLVYGGDRPGEHALAAGLFLRPALLVGCAPDREVWLSQTAGAVLLVHRAEDGEQALSLAEGLSGPVAVFSEREEFARRLAMRPREQVVLWNSYDLAAAGAFYRRDRHWLQGERLYVRNLNSEPSGWYRGQ